MSEISDNLNDLSDIPTAELIDELMSRTHAEGGAIVLIRKERQMKGNDYRIVTCFAPDPLVGIGLIDVGRMFMHMQLMRPPE